MSSSRCWPRVLATSQPAARGCCPVTMSWKLLWVSVPGAELPTLHGPLGDVDPGSRVLGV